MSKLSDFLVTRETFDSDKYQDLLSQSKYERLAWDDFNDGGLVEATAMTLESDGYGFTAGQVLTSTNLLDTEIPTYSITECFVYIEYEDAATPTIEITANGGVNWEVAENHNIHTFSVTGSDLRLRFTAGGTGKVRSWALLYYPHTSSLIEEAVSLTGKGINIVTSLPVWSDDYKGVVVYLTTDNNYYAGLKDRWISITPQFIRENLIGNSGFGVWGDSEDLFAIQGNILSNGDFATNITGWTDKSTGTNNIYWSATGGVNNSGALVLNLPDSANKAIASIEPTLKRTRLYRVKAVVTTNTIGGTPTVEITRSDASGETILDTVSITGTPQTIETLLVPLNTDDDINFNLSAASTGTLFLDDVEVYEIGPGIESTTPNGPTLWAKNEAKVYRQYIEENEDPQTTYCIKIVPDITNGAALYFPNNLEANAELSWLDKVKGKTLVVGAWLWCDTPDSFRIRSEYLNDQGWTVQSSPYHSGSSNWEWIEFITTIPKENIKEYHINFYMVAGLASGKVACPILAQGLHIGEGNWMKKTNDIIPSLDIIIPEINGAINTGEFEIDIQISSEGKLPINLEFIGIKGVTQEVTADADAYLLILNEAGLTPQISISNAGLPASTQVRGSGMLYLNSSKYKAYIVSGGVGTFSFLNFRYTNACIW